MERNNRKTEYTSIWHWLILVLIFVSGFSFANQQVIPIGGRLSDIAIDETNNIAYVVALGGMGVSIVDLTEGKLVGNIPPLISVGNNVAKLAIDAPNERLYLLNFNRVSIIDTLNKKVLKDITFGSPPKRMHFSDIAMDRDKGILYISSPNAEDFSMENSMFYLPVNPEGNYGHVLLPDTEAAQRIAFDSLNKRVIITSRNSMQVSVVDSQSNTLIGTSSANPAYQRPFGVTVNQLTGQAWASIQGGLILDRSSTGGVAKITVNGNIISQQISTLGPQTNLMDIAIDENQKIIYLPNYEQGTVILLNEDDLSPIGKPINVGSQILVLSLNQATNTLYTASFDGNFYITPMPRIDQLSTTEAVIGETITLAGSNFDPVAKNNQVLFAGGVSATPSAVTDNSLTVSVPEGTQNGTISILTNGITSKASAASLMIFPETAISSISPSVAIPGSTVTILGQGFSSTPENNRISFFMGGDVTPTQATSTQLTFNIPSTAKSGPLSIAVRKQAPVISNEKLSVVNVQHVALPSSVVFYAIASDGKGYAASGKGGNIMNSADGINWTLGESGSNYTLGSMCYGNGNYFTSSGLLSSGVEVIYSSTGTNWRKQKVADTYSVGCRGWDDKLKLFYGISIFSNGLNGVATSGNALRWQKWLAKNQQTGDIYGLAGSSGRFIAGGNGSQVFISADAYTWNSKTANKSLKLTDIAFSTELGIFAAIEDNAEISYTRDGENWAQAFSGEDDFYIEDITWSRSLGMFVAGGRLGHLIASNDGIHWSTLPETGSIKSLASNNNSVAGVGESGMGVIITPN
jgi:hypothetical protein